MNIKPISYIRGKSCTACRVLLHAVTVAFCFAKQGGLIMSGTAALGYQNYEEIITGDILYIDKTNFISEW